MEYFCEYFYDIGFERIKQILYIQIGSYMLYFEHKVFFYLEMHVQPNFNCGTFHVG